MQYERLSSELSLLNSVMSISSMVARISRTRSREPKVNEIIPSHRMHDRSPSPRRFSGRSLMTMTRNSTIVTPHGSTKLIDRRRWQVIVTELSTIPSLDIVSIITRLDDWLELLSLVINRQYYGSNRIEVDVMMLTELKNDIANLRYVEAREFSNLVSKISTSVRNNSAR